MPVFYRFFLLYFKITFSQMFHNLSSNKLKLEKYQKLSWFYASYQGETPTGFVQL